MVSLSLKLLLIRIFGDGFVEYKLAYLYDFVLHQVNEVLKHDVKLGRTLLNHSSVLLLHADSVLTQEVLFHLSLFNQTTFLVETQSRI